MEAGKAVEKKSGYGRYALSVAAGTAVILLGDWLLGVRLEVFKGIHTFTFAWMLDLLVVPFVSGVIVSAVQRSRMGKWLAYAPPFLARSGTLVYLLVSAGSKAIHFSVFYWGALLLMVMEFGNIGGFLGDYLFGGYHKGGRAARKVAGKGANP